MSAEARRARGRRDVQTAVAAKRSDAEHRHAAGEIVTCWLCNQPIDMTIIDRLDDEFYEPDHVFPISTHPELGADPDNLRDSHRGCNRERGSEMEGLGLGWTSEDWEALAYAGEHGAPSAHAAGRTEPAPSSTEYAEHRTTDSTGYPDLFDD